MAVFKKNNLLKNQSFVVILCAAILLEATSLIQLYSSKSGLRKEADARAQSELTVTKLKIENVVVSIENDTRGMAWALGDLLDKPESFEVLAKRLMGNNSIIVNSFIALEDSYYPDKGHWYEPVLTRTSGGYYLHQVAGEDHDYFLSDWYTVPLQTGEGYWSEPYFDKDGVAKMVVTFSTAIYDKLGSRVGIFGVDIELDWLQEMTDSVKPYDNSYSTLTSRNGEMLASHSETVAAKDVLKYDTSFERTGWKISIVIPEKEIYSRIRSIGLGIMILQIFGLLVLLFIIQRMTKQQKKLEKISISREKIEEELRIAREIQMAMLPKIFPPYPERSDIDVLASMVPAKEVGGDLYDFYIRDEKLFFCIGDVSGKGVPAALVMAVTRSLFRTISAHENSPARIVTEMNESMSADNERNMFVTFFCGVLDLHTGHMRYCNAGHNAPVLLNTTKSLLNVVPNLPLGILPGMNFQEQETDLSYEDAIFLYTDGLTEAENARHEMFGEDRMLAVLSGLKGTSDHMHVMENAVSGFVAGAPQSDDLTMLFIRYQNKDMSDTKERHLLIHNDIQQIPQLADFVQTIAGEMKLDHSLTLSINLALEEAVTNVIMYAYPKGKDGLVDIEAVIREKTLSFIISDSGQPFDPTAGPEADVTLSAEDRPIGGLGIYLVRNIMDTVTYERKDGKNYLSMTKNI